MSHGRSDVNWPNRTCLCCGRALYLTNVCSLDPEDAMSREQRHVVRDGDDWVVRKPGADRASSRHDTQREADRRAADILRNLGGGERVTHGRDGKIRSKDTIPPANDPLPPRDKEH